MTQKAHQKYINNKTLYNKFRKNPFSIDSTKADIDPFKEFINRHKTKLCSKGDKDIAKFIYE